MIVEMVLLFTLVTPVCDAGDMDCATQRLLEERSQTDVTHDGPKEGLVWYTEDGELAMFLTPRSRTRQPFSTLRDRRTRPRPAGSCDTQGECEAKIQQMCSDAKKGGVDKDSVEITVHADGRRTCSGNCTEGCNINGCPKGIVECGPLT